MSQWFPRWGVVLVLVYPCFEAVDVLDAGAIVADRRQAGDGGGGANPLATVEALPLWNQLPAVSAGRVHVAGDARVGGIGHRSSQCAGSARGYSWA